MTPSEQSVRFLEEFAAGNLFPRHLEALPEGLESHGNVLRACVVPHDADAPDLAHRRPETPGNLDTARVHCKVDELLPVDVLRHLHNVRMENVSAAFQKRVSPARHST